jgi:phosphoribosylamine--glycine ligase
VRICLASEFGEGAWLAWLMAHEGHDVSAAIKNERYSAALGGLIEVMPGAEVYKPEEYALVVFDATGNGKYADQARLAAPTIGDSVLADQLEEDRLFALDFMQRCGLSVAPYEAFSDPSDGIRYIKKRNKRLVFKPIGEQDDKSTTYVSRSASDMLRYFDVLFRSAKVKEYILQDYVEGVEVSTEVYINSTGYYALNHTLETKKFMNDDMGPNTGCSGSLCWMPRDSNPIFEKGLKKCVEPLQEMGYVGPIDLNTIIGADGQCSALEFTPRMGYDASALLTRLLPVGFGDFLYAIASQQSVPDLTPHHPFCASVRLSVPPYPCEGLPEKFIKQGVPIEGLREKDFPEFFVYDLQRHGETDELETAGLCGWVGSPLSVGETIGQAFDHAYETLKRIRVPNAQYRTDMCDNTSRRYWQLREHGWLKG